MKKIPVFFAAAIAVSILFSSCGDKEEKKEPDAPSASGENKPELLDAIVVRHKVADYAKWKVAYDKNDSMRLSAGIHSYIVARGAEDSNMVLVSMRVEDTAKAKQFIANPALKKVMMDAGVIGDPKLMIVHRIFEDTSTNSVSLRNMVVLKVKDYDAWRKGFDADKQNRLDNGIKDRIIAQSIEDKNTVVAFFAITDPVKAKAFSSSKELQQRMKDSGVIGAPEMFMYNVVQRY